jgi:hypothetical protein
MGMVVEHLPKAHFFDIHQTVDCFFDDFGVQ